MAMLERVYRGQLSFPQHTRTIVFVFVSSLNTSEIFLLHLRRQDSRLAMPGGKINREISRTAPHRTMDMFTYDNL